MFFRLQTRWSFNYSRLLHADSRIKYGVVLTDVENWLLHVNIYSLSCLHGGDRTTIYSEVAESTDI